MHDDISNTLDRILECLGLLEAGHLTAQQQRHLDTCREAAIRMAALAAGIGGQSDHSHEATDAGAEDVRADPEVAPLIPAFLEKRRADAVRLRRLIDRAEWPAIQTLGYRMKGTGRGYGFRRISESGAALEEAGRHEDAGRARAAAYALAAYLDHLETAD